MSSAATSSPSMPMALVVDDDAMLGQVIASTVRRVGWVPVVVSSATEAKASLAARRWAVVICDLQLAGDSGLSVITAARAAAGAPRIIAITGLPDADFYLKVATRAGAHAVLAKPFMVEALLALLQSPATTPAE